MPPKTTPKRNTTSLWTHCENCSASIVSRDSEMHSLQCPPNINDITHSFIKDSVLYGIADVKTNEDIKGLSKEDLDNLVFVSQSTVQLCNLAIGDCALIEDVASGACFARTVWPMSEKSLTSVLFTKQSLDLTNLKIKSFVKVIKLEPSHVAQKISVTILNGPKSLELTPELQNRVHKSYVGKAVTHGNILSILFYGKFLKLEIKNIEGQHRSIDDEFSQLTLETNFYKVVDKTSFCVYKNESEYQSEIVETDPLSAIGGLSQEITELKELIEAALEKSKKFANLKSTKGVLLYGNSGTGKTLLANAILKTTKATIVTVNAANLYSKYTTNPDDTIRSLFSDATEGAPSVIFLDEVDILCPQRSNRMTDAEKRIVSCLLTQIDDISNSRIFILAATNKLDAIDPAFRRCGRFEREIEVPVPNPKNRFEILAKILGPERKCIDDEVLRKIANETHGFVGADLVALCSRAALHAGGLQRDTLEVNDFKFALTKVRPSAMREVQVEVPNVKWTDIGGQENLKLILKQCIEWPLQHADSFIRLGVTPPRGVLMYGPPGCSKTMIAKALATESGLNFLSIKGPELFSKWVGESERAVREVFRKARQVAPSVIFFDEIDALGGERSSSATSSSVQERVLAQLLTELDGVTPLGDVTILAATNRPDRMDKALLRPGRLDRIVYVPLPDEKTRADIFRIKFRKMPVQGTTPEILALKTEGYSGAEVNAVCHEAAMLALQDSLDAEVIDLSHFDGALKIVTPRTPVSLLSIYEEYNK